MVRIEPCLPRSLLMPAPQPAGCAPTKRHSQAVNVKPAAIYSPVSAEGTQQQPFRKQASDHATHTRHDSQAWGKRRMQQRAGCTNDCTDNGEGMLLHAETGISGTVIGFFFQHDSVWKKEEL